MSNLTLKIFVYLDQCGTVYDQPNNRNAVDSSFRYAHIGWLRTHVFMRILIVKTDETGGAQADLSLCWGRNSFCWFCLALAYIHSHKLLSGHLAIPKF